MTQIDFETSSAFHRQDIKCLPAAGVLSGAVFFLFRLHDYLNRKSWFINK